MWMKIGVRFLWVNINLKFVLQNIGDYFFLIYKVLIVLVDLCKLQLYLVKKRMLVIYKYDVRIKIKYFLLCVMYGCYMVFVKDQKNDVIFYI